MDLSPRPLSEARFQGDWQVQVRGVGNRHFALVLNQNGDSTPRPGKTITQSWRVVPSCDLGPCSVGVTTYVNYMPELKLERHGSSYAGTYNVTGGAPWVAHPSCSPMQVAVSLKIVAGQFDPDVWVASDFRGSMKMSGQTGFSCHDASAAFTIKGQR